MDEVAKKALAAYGFTVQNVAAAQKGYRNSSHKATVQDDSYVNLIVYKSEPGIAARITRLHQVSLLAAKSGLPVRVPIDSRILKVSDSINTRYAAVYSYLPGRTIPWEGYTKHHIKLLGMSMGKLHTALQGSTNLSLPLVTDEQLVLNARMQTYFAGQGVVRAVEQKLAVKTVSDDIFQDFSRCIQACAKLPNQQPLHMDLVRGNILFDNPSSRYKLSDGPVVVSGIIDFEKTAEGHSVFDLARTYAFLLVDCKYKTETKIHKYFFQSGYQKRGCRPLPTITYDGHDVLTVLTNFFLVHDFYKFLRHNPYEFLEQNEHYARTRDILIARGLLERI